jgi:hypothetical protein
VELGVPQFLYGAVDDLEAQDFQQDTEKVRRLRSRFAQRLNAPKRKR